MLLFSIVIVNNFPVHRKFSALVSTALGNQSERHHTVTKPPKHISFSTVKLVHFHISNKEVEVTEIFKFSWGLSGCQFCQVGALILITRVVMKINGLQNCSNLSGINNIITQTKSENTIKESLSRHLVFGLWYVALSTTYI